MAELSMPTVDHETEAFKVLQVIEQRAWALGDEQYARLAKEAKDHLSRATTQPAEQSASSPVEGVPDPWCHSTGWEAKRSEEGRWVVGMSGNLDTVHDATLTVHRRSEDGEDERIARWLADTFNAALSTRSVAVSSEAVDQIATMIFDNPKIPGEFNLSDARELARSILESHPAHEAGEVETLKGLLREAWASIPTTGPLGERIRAALEDKAQGAQQ